MVGSTLGLKKLCSMPGYHRKWLQAIWGGFDQRFWSLNFLIFFPEFFASTGVLNFRTKSAETFCRGFKKQIPSGMYVLGLGGHRLQSLSTFHRVVKKLAHFEFAKFLATLLLFYLGFPMNPKMEIREKKNMGWVANCIFMLQSKNIDKLECFYKFRKLDWALWVSHC